jgi:NhaA family Na+:H+ antiporter
MDQRAPAAKQAPPLTVIFRPLERFLHVEAASGILLLAAAVLALVWANSPWREGYQDLWSAPFSLGFPGVFVEQPLRFWINEGLMTVFFLVVGLEIRRELHEGALSSLRLATLPIAAAVGGILVPALIYLSLNREPPLFQGWAIPTATDIAFAIGVLALLSSRVSPDLRALLLAIAIADDIAAIVVIAIFYSEGIAPHGFIVALGGITGVFALQRLGVRHVLAYVIAGFVVWLGLLQAHVHPTLAGVLLGLLTPVSTIQGREKLLMKAQEAVDEIGKRIERGKRNEREIVSSVRRLASVQREILSPVVRIEAVLHPWVAYGVMPLFALANAGVVLEGSSFDLHGSGTVIAGAFLALVLGKPLGIVAFSWLAVKFGIAALPTGSNWRGIVLIGLLGGIGFTMSIFIANLAFHDEGLLASAKLGVLVASIVAGSCGLLFGRLMLARQAAVSSPGNRPEQVPGTYSGSAGNERDNS